MKVIAAMRLLFLLTLTALLVSPDVTLAAGKPAKKATYDDNVVPILREKCFACHGQDRKSGGLRVNNYTSLMAGGGSGAVIKPGDADGSLLYQLVTHKQEPNMPPKSPPLPKEMLDVIRQWIEAGAPENSGSKVVVANKPKFNLSLSSVSKGRPVGPPPMPHNLPTLPIVHTSRANAITAIASSPWAPLVAVAGEGQVSLYNSDTLDLVGVLAFPEGVPYVLKFSRNGSLLLAGGGIGGKSGRVVVWKVTTGERVFTVGDETDAVLAADISADQTQIALGGPSKMIRIYSTKDGKLLREIKKHTDWVLSLEYSPDGVLLATTDRNGGLFVWEAFTGREYFSLRGHTAAVTDLSWRPDGNVLASCSEDGTIRLWEMENGNQIKSWGAHGGGAESISYTHDGRLVSCGRDRVTRVWNGNGNQQRAFDAFTDIALRAAFSDDGKRVIAGDWTGSIRVWDAATGKQVGSLRANPPTLVERLESAHKELAARKAAYEQVVKLAAASQAAADQASAALTAAQQELAARVAQHQAAQTALAKLQNDLKQATAGLPAAQGKLAAKETAARVYADACSRLETAAAQARDKKEFTVEVTKAQKLRDLSAHERAQAKHALETMQGALKSAQQGLPAAQQALTQTAAAVQAGQKVVSARTQDAQKAVAKANVDKTAVTRAAAEGLAAANSLAEKWNAVLAASRPPQKATAKANMPPG